MSFEQSTARNHPQEWKTIRQASNNINAPLNLDESADSLCLLYIFNQHTQTLPHLTHTQSDG